MLASREDLTFFCDLTSKRKSVGLVGMVSLSGASFMRSEVLLGSASATQID